MADPTESFIMPTKYLTAIETMQDDAAGKLFKALTRWVVNGFDQFDPVPDVAVATFASLRDDVLDSKGKWIETCRKNAQNAVIGWEKRRAREKTLETLRKMREDASASDGMQTHTKNADKDTGTGGGKDLSVLCIHTQGQSENGGFFIPSRSGIFANEIIRQKWLHYVSVVRPAHGWSVKQGTLVKLAQQLEAVSGGDVNEAAASLDLAIRHPYGGFSKVEQQEAAPVQTEKPFADVPEDWDQIGGGQ